MPQRLPEALLRDGPDYLTTEDATDRLASAGIPHPLSLLIEVGRIQATVAADGSLRIAVADLVEVITVYHAQQRTTARHRRRTVT